MGNQRLYDGIVKGTISDLGNPFNGMDDLLFVYHKKCNGLCTINTMSDTYYFL